jgi:hypothetical protein
VFDIFEVPTSVPHRDDKSSNNNNNNNNIIIIIIIIIIIMVLQPFVGCWLLFKF